MTETVQNSYEEASSEGLFQRNLSNQMSRTSDRHLKSVAQCNSNGATLKFKSTLHQPIFKTSFIPDEVKYMNIFFNKL